MTLINFIFVFPVYVMLACLFEFTVMINLNQLIGIQCCSHLFYVPYFEIQAACSWCIVSFDTGGDARFEYQAWQDTMLS